MSASLAINDVTKFLKYANLQMAAEAVKLTDGLTGDLLAQILVIGNNRTSKFPTTLANDFARKWQVVKHQENTTTGFSGTLFECTADDPALGYVKGEQTISFRSTEFIDDVVRDGQETGKLEIQEFGWAFGQIADMKTWVDGLIVGGQIKNAGTHSLDVTGYSLGGHLATAFNDLYPDLIRNTYTFNGAGVGAMRGGNDLATVIADFDRQRKNADKNQIKGFQRVIDLVNHGTDVINVSKALLQARPCISMTSRPTTHSKTIYLEKHHANWHTA